MEVALRLRRDRPVAGSGSELLVPLLAPTRREVPAMTEVDRVWSVRITSEGIEGRLGPYFTLQSARNQASNARRKGATILGIDMATVEWRPENPEVST